MFVWKKRDFNPCCVLFLILFFFFCQMPHRWIKKEHLKTHRRSDIGNMLWLLYRLTTKFWAIVAFGFWLWHKTPHIFATQWTYNTNTANIQTARQREGDGKRTKMFGSDGWNGREKECYNIFFNACSFAFLFSSVLCCELMFLFLFTPSHSWFQQDECVLHFVFIPCSFDVHFVLFNGLGDMRYFLASSHVILWVECHFIGIGFVVFYFITFLERSFHGYFNEFRCISVTSSGVKHVQTKIEREREKRRNRF